MIHNVIAVERAELFGHYKVFLYTSQVTKSTRKKNMLFKVFQLNQLTKVLINSEKIEMKSFL